MNQTLATDIPIPQDLPAPGVSAGAFFEALEAQIHCYRRLDELSREQARHIESGDTEKLLETLQRRQVYVESVADHERLLSPVKRRWPGSAHGWPQGLRERAEGLLSEIGELLGRITSRDRQDMLVLQQRRLVVGQQLQRSQTDDRNVRRINQTYASAAYTRRSGSMDLRR